MKNSDRKEGRFKKIEKRVIKFKKLRGIKRARKERLASDKEGQLENKLERLLLKLKKRGATKKNLFQLIQNIELLSLKISALKTFLANNDLTFNDFYKLIDIVEVLLPKTKDKNLEEKFWQKCFKIAAPDNLVEIIKYKRGDSEERVLNELLKRIENGAISEGYGRQILSQLIKEYPEEELRKRLLGELEKLNPSYEELRDLDFLKATTLAGSLYSLMRKKFEKEPNAKIIQQILEVDKKLSELKRGQV